MATASFQAGDDARSLPAPVAGVAALRGTRRAHVALTTVTALAIYFVGPGLGLTLPASAVVILALGALVVELAPARAMELSATAGVVLLARLHPSYAVYYLILVAVLFACRKSSLLLGAALAALAIVIPKLLYAHHYHQPVWWAWLNEPSLAAAIFVTATWWREARDGRLPVPVRDAPAPDTWPPQAVRAPTPTEQKPSPFAVWSILFLLPTHAVNPITFGPGDLWRGRRADGAGVLRAVALFVVKAAALAGLRAVFPGHRYADLSPDRLMGLTAPALWGVVALNYLDLVLLLSGTADLAIAIARLYGWSLPSPFRWSLLAWNPVELWRRWGIYNRRFLLKTVYFPLGGGARRRLLNVMLTFLASAMVLHSGWFGSKYWTVGAAGWRDHAIYFLIQGAAVCACLGFWRATGKDAGTDRALRLSWTRVPGTLATQALSALVHVIILAQSVSLAQRGHLIARCLGW